MASRQRGDPARGSSPARSSGGSLVLAVETATAAASVAVLRGERLLAECAGEGPHAETLLPAVDRALEGAGVVLDAIEAFAVSIGPGSFTGLRIGLATVKGMAFGTDRLVAPVPTLAGLAWSARQPGVTLVPVLDARRDEVYAAAYALRGERLESRLEPGVYRPAELAPRLSGPCLLVGEARDGDPDPVLAVVADALGASVEVSLAPPGRATWARAIGVLGARILAAGEARPAGEVIPRYLRRAQAEVLRTGSPFEDPAGAPPEGGLF